MVDDTFTVNFAKVNLTKTNCKRKMLPDENEQMTSNGDDICQYMLLVPH